MSAHSYKSQKKKSRLAARVASRGKRRSEPFHQHANNRHGPVIQRKMDGVFIDCLQVKRVTQSEAMTDTHPAPQEHSVQRKKGEVDVHAEPAGLLPHKVRRVSQQKRHPRRGSLTDNDQLIQRVVMPLIGPGVALAGGTLAKFNEVIAAMNLAMGPVGGIVVMVSVDDNDEPNPAETAMSAMVGVDIEVHLRKWYLEISSVGEIVGLIAHELGVHTLADLTMSRRALRRERRRNAAGTGFQVNANGQMVGVAGWGAPVAHNRDAQGRQRDHVNVVRDQGGVAGNASARTRAYVDTMLQLGDNINAGPGPAAARDRKLRDLVKTFLFDYARILVTDDGGPWATFSNADIISHVMQWYQAQLVPRHVAAHAWLMNPAVHVNSTAWGIRGWLLKKLAAYVANRGLAMAKRGINAVGRAARGMWNRVFG